MDLTELIARAADGVDLTADESEAAFHELMSGRATPVQTAALLVALRTKGHAPSEVAGGVRAMRRAMLPVRAPATGVLIDTCGTGGGAVTTFNISTAAAFVAASAVAHAQTPNPDPAQQPAQSFEDVRALLSSGDTVHVYDDKGTGTKGRLSSIRDGVLNLTFDSTRRTVPFDTIVQIDRTRRDPVKDGVLKGLAAGAVVGWMRQAALARKLGEPVRPALEEPVIATDIDHLDVPRDPRERLA